ELVESNTFTTVAANKFELLRSAAIYGPNASGKSNFLLALQTMKEIILESATNLQRGDKLPVTPFRLSKATRHAPSEFEVIFIVDKVRYQYGFSATEDRIHEEWLMAYPKGRPQRWLGRIWDEQKQSYDWELGNNLTGEKQLWQKSTRDNALFLSTAVQLNSEQLQPVYDWFNDTLHMTNISGWSPGFSASLCEKSEKAQVMDFLRAADLNIEDIVVETEPFDIKALPDDMPTHVKKMFADELKDKKLVDIKTVHKSEEGDKVTFDFEDESDGTRKLFAFAGPWIDTLANGYVLFIDELHDNLHPRLVQFLVRLFHNSETNPKNAQLVFTTHETSILNQDEFRRDQIWFCEKGEDQATTLYPLTDFSPRKGRENLELAYLSGRYGALPYVRPLRKRA
ncbi:MAG TPA: ATP-binding protein, partial [Gammaproteobacteria bacterium]|nr:ATP-binding protein [Gammaproteobacteria bacterium]